MIRIYNRHGDVPFNVMTFPDGQPHVEVPSSMFGDEPSVVTIEASIRDPRGLFDVLAAKSALDTHGVSTRLDLRYLLGARMDRRIGRGHPATLEIVCRSIVAAGFSRIRVLDPHSVMCLRLLGAEAVYPTDALACMFRRVLQFGDEMLILAPDAGAVDRVAAYQEATQRQEQFRVVSVCRVIVGRKSRDAETGVLSGFSIADASMVRGKRVLIMDDLCDGGRTFSGQAAILREHGAIGVELYVTHGIFSKGTPIDGVDHIYTTDSYAQAGGGRLTMYPIEMRRYRS